MLPAFPDTPKRAARDHFQRALERAQMSDLMARLTGRPNDLLPFDALSSALKVFQQIPRGEPIAIPLDQIVGSVGRYKDFTRDFLPRSAALGFRWAKVEDAMESLEGVPPIEVYQLGSVYFVADGNHRVSVARANGFREIDAYITEIPVDPGIQPGDTLDQAISKAERARFLAETQLDTRFPELDIFFTRPGGFGQLLQHVQFHRTLMQRERNPQPGAEIPLADAAADWYERSYQPIIAAIRERQLLCLFPDRTAADLYVWIWGYILEAYRCCGESVSPEEGADMLALRAPAPFRKVVDELMRRLGELSAGRFGARPDIPDWVTQTFEWDDGSLAELADMGQRSDYEQPPQE